MKTMTAQLSLNTFDRRRIVKNVVSDLTYCFAYVVLAAFLIMLVMFSVPGEGRPTAIETLTEGVTTSYGNSESISDEYYTDEDCDESYEEIIADESDDGIFADVIDISDCVAEAGTSEGGSSSYIAASGIKANNSSDYLKTSGYWTYSYSGNPGGSLYRKYYWEGNSSDNNYSTGSGWVTIEGGGTVRQKEIVFTAYIKIKVSGVMQSLAQASKLKIVYASATLSSTNEYNQDMKWGIMSGSQYIANGSSPWSSFCTNGTGAIGGSLYTDSSGESATKSSSGLNLTVSSNTITIALSARTNYTSWVGGRYPGAKISNIKIGFRSADTTGPSVSVPSYSSWAQSRNVAVTVTDSESGNDMYSYSSNYTRSGVNNNVHTFSNVYGAFNVTFTNRSLVPSSSSTANWTADQLKIDRNYPTVSNLMLVSSSSTSASAISSNTAYSALYLKFTASDSQSGIKTITVTNTTTSTALSRANVSGSTYVYGPLNQNGYYKVSVTDNVGWTTTRYLDCYALDKVAPVIKNVIYEYNGTASASLSDFCYYTSASDYKYAQSAVKVTFVICERADSTYYAYYNNDTYKNMHSIKSVTFSSDSGTYTPVESASGWGSVTYHGTTYSETGAWMYYYSYYMPQTIAHKMVVTDKVSKTVQQSGIKPYIDTSAPSVSSYSLAPTTAKTQWTNQSVTLNLILTDTYTGIINQGSGLQTVLLFRNSLPSLTWSSSSSAISSAKSQSNYIGCVNFDKGTNSNTAQFVLNKYDYIDATSYYWIVYDYAGNYSKMSSSTATWNGTSYSNYYYSPNTNNYVSPIKRDAQEVKIVVKGSNGNTYSTASSSVVKLAWTSDTSTTFSITNTFGPSGATLKVKSVIAADATDASINAAISALGDANAVQLYGSDDSSFKDAINNSSNKKKNTVTVSHTVSGEGVTVYKYILTNGAGVQAESGAIVVKRDTKGPEVKLLGFGTAYNHSSSVSTDSAIISRIENYISESALYTNYSGTNWYGNQLYAVVRVKDSGSGVSTASQAYHTSENNLASTSQASKAEGILTFSYTGTKGTYTKSWTYSYQQGNGLAVFYVPLWDLSALQEVSGFYNSSTETYDIKQGSGTPFTYTMTLYDFVGKSTYVTNSGGSSTLSYYVDPFQLEVSVDSIVQIDSNNNTTSYNSRPNGEWTRNKVVINVNKLQMGLSPVTVKYYTKTISQTSTGTPTDLITGLPDGNSTQWQTALVEGDSGSGSTAKIVFPAASRFVQVAIMVSNYTSTNRATLQAFMPDGSGGTYTDYPIIIRQDIDAPNMNGTGYFFSTNPDITTNPINADGSLREDVLLYYKTTLNSSGGYDSTRLTNNKGVANVWSHLPVYLYVIATDATGTSGVGVGSGINKIVYTANTQTETLGSGMLKASFSNYSVMYRSNKTVGYTALTENYPLKLTLVDNRSNSVSLTMSNDTDGKKIFPILDTVIPLISIRSAVDGSNNSYLRDGRFIGDDDHVLKTDLVVNFNLTSGISGATIYARRRTWQEDIDKNSNLYKNNSSRADGKYGLKSISGLTFNSDGSPVGWEKVNGVSYTISSADAVHHRFDFLVITGAGVYYYMEGGDVFIDTVAPVIDESLTFYALRSDSENNRGTAADPIKYDSLRLATLSTMTNDSLYAYFRITDENGSGVKDDTVMQTMPTKGTVLDKVFVKRVKNGVYVTEEYYRLLLTGSEDYRITASDIAGNVTESAVFRPSIDVNPITLNISMYDSKGKTYEYNNKAYTNTEYVTVVLSASYGLSGRGAVQFATSDDGSKWSAYQDLSVLLTSIGSSAKWTNVGNGASEIRFNISNEQNKYYAFRAYNGVVVYKIGADGKDVVPMDERGYSAASDPIVIAIDRTAPVVDIGYISIDGKETTLGTMSASAGDYSAEGWTGEWGGAYTTYAWYGKGISIGVPASDPNSFGSGIAEIRLDYKLNGVAQSTAFYSLDSSDGKYYATADGSKFVYADYADYVITLVDRANNESIYVIRPKIDTVKPTIANGAVALSESDMSLDTSDEDYDRVAKKAVYTSGEWSMYNVLASFATVYSISGARLQYQRKTATGNYGEWTDASNIYYYGDFDVADNKKTTRESSTYLFRPEGTELSFNYTYKFRLMSGAGVASDEVEVGTIKIDQEKPEISVAVSTAFGKIEQNGLGTVDADNYTTTMTKWTSDSITVTVKTSSALASSYKIRYNVSQTAANWQEVDKNYGNGASTFQLIKDDKTFIHRITDNTNRENYQYCIESVSGRRSKVYYLNDVKLDKATPSFDVEGEKSDLYGTPDADSNKFATVQASDYKQNLLSSLADGAAQADAIQGLKYTFGVFTNSNSVILRVRITKINYSGVTLSINGYEYEHFDYGASVPIERYYVVSNDYRDVLNYYDADNKRFSLDIRLSSGAGRISEERKLIAIDNTIPFVYVAGISGVKSSNWDPNDYDSCWYVSSDTSINLKVGTLVYDSAQNKYLFSDSISDSSYTIYYAYDHTGTTPASQLDWINNNTTSQVKLLGKPYVEKQYYRFKIVTGSGMEYILGEDAYSNNMYADAAEVAEYNDLYGVASTSSQVAADKTVVKSIIENIGGSIKHLSDVDFRYRMNVDSTDYSVTINQLLPFTAGGRDIIETRLDFADYTIKKLVNKYDASGAVTGYDEVVMTADDVVYRHGDRIIVEYVSNSASGYFMRRTEYGCPDGEGGYGLLEAGKTEVEYDASKEKSGSYTYQFGYTNMVLNSYFIKEIVVTYGGTTIYRQSDVTPEVTATTSYSYRTKDSGGSTVTLTANIVLNKEYLDMSGDKVVDLSGAEIDDPILEPVYLADGTMYLGGYLLNALVVGDNALSFRLVNPQTVVLVKYFQEALDSDNNEFNNGTEHPYTLVDEEDFRYINKTYYTNFTGTTGSFALGAGHLYSDCVYSLTADVDFSEAFEGICEFGGSLDGQNHKLTLAGGTASGDYGFIGSLSGTVSNLSIGLRSELVINDGEDVGILASVIEGGSVKNVRVSGRMTLNKLVADGSVGALAGRIVGYSDIDKVFVDAVIGNKGSRIDYGRVGGLTGYIGSDAAISDSYVYSHITVYNVGDGLKVGAVAGELGKTLYASEESVIEKFSGNVYLDNNVFKNDLPTKGFAGVDNNIQTLASDAIKGVAHDMFVTTEAGSVGTVAVAGERILELVLTTMYSDFGVAVSENSGYSNGLGTEDEPFVITTQDQLRAIDGYVNLYYVLDGDIDMTDFGAAIGLHKVFGGEFDGQGHKLNDFGGIDVADGDAIGLFAAISGTVKNIVMPTVEIELETNVDELYAGVIAGRLSGGTVSNVILVGTFDVTSGGTVVAGAIAGMADEGEIYDVFSIVNVKVASDVKATVGGLLGYADDTLMGGERSIISGGATVVYSRAIYALGRVEATSISVETGAIAATGTLKEGSSNVYAVKDNAYSNGQIKNSSISGYIDMVTFDDDAMRNTTFSDGTNAFNKVFVSDKLYYLDGLGRSTDKFSVTTAEQFKRIDHMLYAHYNIANDIAFDDSDEATAFETIGYGLKFTGSIDGKNKNSWSAEEGTLSSLMNVTGALVYNNAGSITDLGINVDYEATVQSGEELTFGAVTIINSDGTLRNVTVSGEINIVGADKYDTTAIISGFVGVGLGGVFDTDSKVQNSISGLNISISNVGTVYAGGYVGKVDGLMTLSYGIGNGTLAISDCGQVYAGTLVGAAYKQNEWTSLEETAEYRYVVTVDGTPTTELFGYKIYE